MFGIGGTATVGNLQVVKNGKNYSTFDVALYILSGLPATGTVIQTIDLQTWLDSAMKYNNAAVPEDKKATIHVDLWLNPYPTGTQYKNNHRILKWPNNSGSNPDLPVHLFGLGKVISTAWTDTGYPALFTETPLAGYSIDPANGRLLAPAPPAEE
jgi:hypothetical protein